MFGTCREFSGRLFHLGFNLSCSISFRTSTFHPITQLSSVHRLFLRSASGVPVLKSAGVIRYLSGFPHPTADMDLKGVLGVLEQLAPLSLAESWDNVGLLVEPSKPRPIRTILLTNDLTAGVMDEAVALNCDLIVSYHPPLFRPFKRLLQKDWKQRLAVRAIEAGIAIFSPHTSWDSVEGGVNDWLVGGMGSGKVSVLSQALSSGPQKHRLEFSCVGDELNSLLEQLRHIEGSENLQCSSVRNESGEQQVNLICNSSALTAAVQTLLSDPHASRSLTITQVQQPPLLGCGQGRLSVLDEPVSVSTAVQNMKTHLGLPHLRLALGDQQTLDSLVKTVAVCAGSGASVIQAVKADLYITGEMSHHEVLDAVSKGTSVILSDHSNSERGFLTVFRQRLNARLGHTVTVAISQKDQDPLQVV
ncbi:NIF3-like protein 1 [Carassius auratus]|uniref:NIF3-like protein 1 n=1 Tax=Carassius auratus TaxID=7957 RepID=A0A6P6L668_CARAU|nr:NIF3-like protein 1 [Carassius auratus]XP_026078977.1 NIF3-like protein 1 [Carassius auratus]XP_026078978.1 NIF3-like protein 1 [Carassius auratus]